MSGWRKPLIKVLLIDQVMVREFLSVALRFEEGLTVVGEVGDRNEALGASRQRKT